MEAKKLRGAAAFVLGLVALLVLSGIPGLTAAYEPKEGTRQGELILNVGGQDEMKTRNLLPANANDVWTSDVLSRMYMSPILGHPVLDRAMAYIGKGVDFDEDGTFEPVSEYDVWREQSPAVSSLSVVLYYDFNGAKWHDGVQITPWDLLFSYHLQAMNARFNTDMRILFPNGKESSYDPGRQLNMEFVAKNWEGEGSLEGDPNLRVAVKFTLTEPFALFYDSTIFYTLLPMHVWSRTGGGRHADFGCAVWIPTAEASAKGLAECGTDDPVKIGKGIGTAENVLGSRPFDYLSAETWEVGDDDLIGSGPFKFDQFRTGIEAKVLRFEDFFTGVDDRGTTDTGDDIRYDTRLASMLKKPKIDGIRFRVYKTTQLGVFALQSGEIDYYHWNVGAEFVPDLLKIPSIAVESNAEPGFFYMAYNMRKAPWGYEANQPANDIGYIFRQAASHLVDKKSIVQNLLQNFGVIGHSVISPANTFWYNDNIPKPEYDPAQAKALLDSPEAVAAGISADPPGACSKDTPTGCRSLRNKGTASFEILTPQADYDPIRASAGAMVAQAMRDVGINAVAKPTAFGEITNRINNRDFDVYILGWRIGGTDPDYLFSFFHSSNAGTGQNYPGFNNASFDQAVDASRAELDRTLRRDLVFTAQDILAKARPYEVLYYRTNIEGYRQDRFVNWTVSSGTIWGFWSLMGIRPPSTTSLRAEQPVVRSAVSANQSVPVVATVRDNRMFALPGATVNLTTTGGVLKLGTPPGAPYVIGTTNVNGQVTATFIAPEVTSETQVLIRAKANHTSFENPHISTSALVTVFPPGQSFLSVELGLPAGDVVRPGASLIMSVTVRDQAGMPMNDAELEIAVEPSGGLSPDPASGPAIDLATVTLTANVSVNVQRTFNVTVVAKKASFTDGMALVGVTVLPEALPPCPDGRPRLPNGQCPTAATPGLEVVAIVAAIGAVALVAGVRHRRKRGA